MPSESVFKPNFYMTEVQSASMQVDRPLSVLDYEEEEINTEELVFMEDND